jgi:hypothetical protein
LFQFTVRTDGYIVAIDNRSYMLLVRCVEGFFRDYMLYTTRPSVSLALYNNILNITRNLGFDERRLQLASYDSCNRFRGINVSALGELQTSRRRVFPESSAASQSGLVAPFVRNNLRSDISSSPVIVTNNVPRNRLQGFPQPHGFPDPGNPFGFPPPPPQFYP